MEKRGLKPLVIQETLVIVHWETLDSSMRGINIPNSKKFLEIHRTSFDRESLSCFRAKFIAIPTIRTKEERLDLLDLGLWTFFSCETVTLHWKF